MVVSSSNFASEIKPDFYCTQTESVFGSLFKEYERVIFRSLITSFGLDLFIRDQYGGDVDTIHNVRQIGDGSPMTYKNAANAAAYDSRGEYSHKDVEGTGTNYQRKKHEARKRYGEDNNNTVQDAYEDKPLGFLGKSKGHPTDRSAELDHVIAAKSIHDDRGRVLSGLSTAELADAEDNLQWTNEHLNKSMGADEIPDYIAAHPELPEDVKKRMMDAYNRAKASYEDKINRAYYFDFSNPKCRQFYKDAFAAAGKRGIQMGLRQALGFLLTELWFSVKAQVEISDGTFTGVLSAIKNGVSNWIENARRNYKEIFAKFGEGVISGFISSLTTTLVNTFLTTSQNAVRIIRQAWASIVESINVLLFNSKEKYLCDRMTAAAKVLASGASVIIGTSVQEAVELKLAEVAIPSDIKSIASTFCGTLATGLLTVSFLFYIDNDPFRKFLDCIYGATTDELRRQGALFKEYCAKLQQMDMREFQRATDYAYSLSIKLQSAGSNAEVNRILKKAQADLGLDSPWGAGSLDDKMQDRSWVLRF